MSAEIRKLYLFRIFSTNFDEAEKAHRRELNLFKRERVLTEIRILGIATYIQTSSTRKIAKNTVKNEIFSATNSCS